MPIVKKVNKSFFKKWTPQMAYIAGYFSADGSMIKNKRGAYFIEFTTTDKILLRQIQKETNSNHKISIRKKKSENHKMQYRLQVGSKEWFKDLSRLGFVQNKSKIISFPHVPRMYIQHFVRGYFDGDGCVYFKKHFARDRGKMKWSFSTRFTCGSKKFLASLHRELRVRGVQKGVVIEKHNKRGYELILSHRDSLALYNFIYHNADAVDFLYLPRKYNLFTKAIKTLYKA